MKYDSFSSSLVEYTGWVVSRVSVMTSMLSCTFDVTKFPIDEQMCNITMAKVMLGNKDFKISKPEEQISWCVLGFYPVIDGVSNRYSQLFSKRLMTTFLKQI